MRHRACLQLFIIIAVLASTVAVFAQEWPQRPVKIVVPYAPGGAADVAAHFVAQPLSEAFGQPFVIEHHPGATGAIAAEAVANAPPDGYTLFLAGLPQIAIMPLAVKTSFDPRKDVIPISAIATNPLVLVVHASVPVKSVAELIDYARGRSDRLAYAATGVGSITHLAMALFLRRAGVDMTPVMYKGGGPAMSDVLAGHVKVQFANVSAVVPYAGGDLLRLLAVSSPRRLAQLANVPTMIECGYSGFQVLNWTGLMAPAGTPRPITDRIAQEISRAAKDAKASAPLIASGFDPWGSTPEEFAAMIAADIPFWSEAVRSAGIQEN